MTENTQPTTETVVEQPAPAYQHPDDLELARLEAEAAAADSAPAEEVPSGEDQAFVTGQQQPAGGADGQHPAPAIPKARFDEVNQARREAEERAAELERQAVFMAGQLEALRGGKPADGEQQQQTEQQDPRATKIAELDALYEAYDSGEIGMADLKKRERALQAEVAEIEREMRRPRPEQIVQAIQADPYLQDRTAALEAENAWLEHVPPAAIQTALVPMARAMLAEQGVQLRADARSTFLLRQAVVAAGKILGLDKGVPSQTPSNQATNQATNGPTVDQRRAKLDLARNHPPAVTTAGTGSPAEPFSAADLDRMSDADLANLPASVLERIAPSK